MLFLLSSESYSINSFLKMLEVIQAFIFEVYLRFLKSWFLKHWRFLLFPIIRGCFFSRVIFAQNNTVILFLDNLPPLHLLPLNLCVLFGVILKTSPVSSALKIFLSKYPCRKRGHCSVNYVVTTSSLTDLDLPCMDP